MQDETWTDERIALLKQLWAAGSTAVAIAERLGSISRSAVLGKIFRLRLGVATAAPSTTSRDESPARRRRVAARKKTNQTPPATPSLRGKTLLELTNDSCRWVVEAAVKWAVAWVLSHFQ